MDDNFERWVEQATRGLPLAVQARTQTELCEHYTAAVQAAVDRGATPHAAHARALQELGDARLTARALRRSHRQPWAWHWLQEQPVLLLLVIGLALISFVGIILRSAGDMGHPTFEALVLQIALLTLLLTLPLAFGDLDLSLGAATMLGVLLARPPTWDGEVNLRAVLLVAGAAGLTLGLLNAVLVTLLRRPAALITIFTGLITLWLAPQFITRPYSGFAVNTMQRISLLTPTLWLTAGIVLLVVLTRQWLGSAPVSASTSWTRQAIAIDRRRRSAAVTIARALAFAISSGCGAIIGAFMVAQGIRDNTYQPLALFLVVVPLAGLVSGGQHRLGGWQRVPSAIAGALVTSALCLHSTQPSDNLAPGAITALGLGIAFGVAWSTTRLAVNRPAADLTRSDAEYRIS